MPARSPEQQSVWPGSSPLVFALFLSISALKAIVGNAHRHWRGLEVDIQPVGVAARCLCTACGRFLPVSQVVQKETSVFIFEQMAGRRSIGWNHSGRYLFHLTEEDRHILQTSDDTGTVHQHQYVVSVSAKVFIGQINRRASFTPRCFISFDGQENVDGRNVLPAF